MDDQRKVLHAYEDLNTCRLARILRKLTARSFIVPRQKVKAEWRTHYCRRVTNHVNDRIVKALRTLEIAGIAHARGDNIIVADYDKLCMAANNLDVVQDANGEGIMPHLQTKRPQVPPELVALQELLATKRAKYN